MRVYAYVELDDTARASSPDAGWQALRRLYACDVPAPDWALPGGMTDEETLEAEEARDNILRRRDFQTDWRTGGLRGLQVFQNFKKRAPLGTFHRNYNYSVPCPCNIYTCANRISMRLFFDLQTRVRIF